MLLFRGRRRLLRAAFTLMAAAPLAAGCLTIETASTPTSPPPTPTVTATVPFPTLRPTSTQTPRPTPSPTFDPRSGLGQAIFTDDFSTDLGWELGERLDGGVSIVGERLAIAVRRPGASLLVESPAPAASDALIEVTVRPILCHDDDEFGVVYRLNSLGEHYRFTITCGSGARARRVLQDGSRALVPFTSSTAILGGPLAENRLAVWASESQFRFLVNGVEIFSARDIALGSGGFGFYALAGRSGQVTVAFDDLIILPLLTSATPSPTP